MTINIKSDILLGGKELTNGTALNQPADLDDGATYKITSEGRLAVQKMGGWKDMYFNGVLKFEGDQGTFKATFEKGQLLILE